MSKALLLTSAAVVLASFYISYHLGLLSEPEIPKLEPYRWWGKGKPPSEDSTKKIGQPRPFKVNVSDEVLEDLKRRLAQTRYSEPLEGSKFHYGMPGTQLKSIVNYWRTKYDWRKHEKEINQFPQYIVNIEGIDIHYYHVKPVPKGEQKLIPLLLIHGWPGSVVEFHKIIPMLTEGTFEFAFEVFCPSIPGYGFSEAPHQMGFGAVDAGRIFNKLMLLHYDKYYVQGGDWGGIISMTMGIFFPENLIGMHLNIALPKNTFKDNFKIFFGSLAPSLVMDPEMKNPITYPYLDLLKFVLEETGYAHFHATKPDTVGAAVTDSPAGLAAYILEKFSTWTKAANRDSEDGKLNVKFTMDELLTNVMIYWTTNTITSSMRFYKEYIHSAMIKYKIDQLSVKVPTGLAIFPNDLISYPRSLLSSRYPNLITFKHMEEGGHFAAFEEPRLLADDIFLFVKKNEDLIKNSKITN